MEIWRDSVSDGLPHDGGSQWDPVWANLDKVAENDPVPPSEGPPVVLTIRLSRQYGEPGCLSDDRAWLDWVSRRATRSSVQERA